MQGPEKSSAKVQTALPAAVELMFEAARRLGVETRLLDPEHGYLWDFALGDGRRRAVIGSKLPVNDAAADRLAQDKHYTNLVLAAAGYRVPAGVRLLAASHYQQAEYASFLGLAPARDLANRLGFPLIVKPNSLSHGRHVALVDSWNELESAVERVFAWDTIALVQERIEGREFRLDFLGEEYLIGYERRPLEVEGDGRSPLAALIQNVDGRLVRGPILDELRRAAPWRQALGGHVADPRSEEALDWVPPPGQRLRLSGTVMNLNRGATAVHLPVIPESWRQWCVQLGRSLGLEHFGLDLRAESLEAAPSSAVVLEVNATPLVLQMAKMGHRETALKAQMAVFVCALERLGAVGFRGAP